MTDWPKIPWSRDQVMRVVADLESENPPRPITIQRAAYMLEAYACLQPMTFPSPGPQHVKSKYESQASFEERVRNQGNFFRSLARSPTEQQPKDKP